MRCPNCGYTWRSSTTVNWGSDATDCGSDYTGGYWVTNTAAAVKVSWSLLKRNSNRFTPLPNPLYLKMFKPPAKKIILRPTIFSKKVVKFAAKESRRNKNYFERNRLNG